MGPDPKRQRQGALGDSSSFFWAPQSIDPLREHVLRHVAPGPACTPNANTPNENDAAISAPIHVARGTDNELKARQHSKTRLEPTQRHLCPTTGDTPPPNNHSSGSACPAFNLTTNHTCHELSQSPNRCLCFSGIPWPPWCLSQGSSSPLC